MAWTERYMCVLREDEMDTNLYAINSNYCPDNDAIIYQGMCADCTYYQGFELYNGQPCIRCSYYADDAHEKKNVENDMC